MGSYSSKSVWADDSATNFILYAVLVMLILIFLFEWCSIMREEVRAARPAPSSIQLRAAMQNPVLVPKESIQLRTATQNPVRVPKETVWYYAARPHYFTRHSSSTYSSQSQSSPSHSSPSQSSPSHSSPLCSPLPPQPSPVFSGISGHDLCSSFSTNGTADVASSSSSPSHSSPLCCPPPPCPSPVLSTSPATSVISACHLCSTLSTDGDTMNMESSSVMSSQVLTTCVSVDGVMMSDCYSSENENSQTTIHSRPPSSLEDFEVDKLSKAASDHSDIDNNPTQSYNSSSTGSPRELSQQHVIDPWSTVPSNHSHSLPEKLRTEVFPTTADVWEVDNEASQNLKLPPSSKEWELLPRFEADKSSSDSSCNQMSIHVNLSEEFETQYPLNLMDSSCVDSDLSSISNSFTSSSPPEVKMRPLKNTGLIDRDKRVSSDSDSSPPEARMRKRSGCTPGIKSNQMETPMSHLATDASPSDENNNNRPMNS